MWSTKCINFRVALKLIVYLWYTEFQPTYRMCFNDTRVENNVIKCMY